MAKLSRYVIGIDLGTTNTAIAYVDRRAGRAARTIRVLEVPQLVAAGDVRARPLLPSFVYLPGEHELPAAAMALPFGKAGLWVVGELARAQGAKVPGRLVASAKSWLCHGQVDRRAPILPWDAPPEVKRISPVEASARILAHLRDAWDHLVAQGDPERAFLAQDIVIGVPASFDAVARALALEAARLVGIERPVLLEEPQAALYAYIAAAEAAGGSLREELAPGSLVLVVDVGGGTTDFTLVSVREAGEGDEEKGAEGAEGLVFERTAVSDHLLLGGDNMDLALARRVAPRLSGEGDGGGGVAALGARGFAALAYACREAKEALLRDGGLERASVALPGAGARLVGGTRTADIDRGAVVDAVLDGFFPKLDPADALPRRSRTGLRELGLPFVADPAVTRHMADFLRRQGPQSRPHPDPLPEGEGRAKAVSGVPYAVPTHVLFNGGAVAPPAVRARVADALAGLTGVRPAELPTASLDLAVARGAAYYGLVRRERGIRIRSGLGRAYYVGVDAGRPRPAALCLIPRGTPPEKPVTVRLGATLQANAPVQFPFFYSSERRDREGALVAEPRLATEEEDGDLHELPPLLTVLRAGSKRVSQRREVPVEAVARLTEIGTLELALHATDGTDRSWRLELSVRAAAPARLEARPGEEDPAAARALDPDRAARARDLIAGAFDSPPGPHGPLPGLARALEETLGQDRDAWPVETCRKLFDLVLEKRDARARSPGHEQRFLNLAGFCLRPGFGAALDDHRVAQMWRLSLSGLAFPKDDAARLEWLIFLRRLAGGLSRGQQEQVYQRLRDDLAGRGARHIPRQEQAEQWKLAASLERLAKETKVALGDRLLDLLERGEGPPRFGVWAIGRLGTRAPQHGPVNETVPREVASRWLDRVLALAAREPLLERDDRAQNVFSIVQMARATGDPTRDLGPEAVARAAARLRAAGVSEDDLRPLHEVQEPLPTEQRLLFGDSVPTGLKLARTET